MARKTISKDTAAMMLATVASGFLAEATDYFWDIDSPTPEKIATVITINKTAIADVREIVDALLEDAGFEIED